MTAIVFVGSVFSPRYARARRRGDACPRDHVAINVALSGASRGWAFVEGTGASSQVQANRLTLGDSIVTRHDDGGLTIDFCGPGTAFDRPLTGRIALRPGAGARAGAAPARALDADGRHHWWPVLPNAEVEVAFTQPRTTWRGRAYHDSNWGQAPLESGFAHWHWMRVQRPTGTQVTYAAQPRDEAQASSAFSHWYGADGREHALPVPRAAALPRSGWRIARMAYGRVRLLGTLLDAPFYSRSRLLVDGADVAMHESLDLRRWQRRWSQFLLGFRLRKLSAPRHPPQGPPRTRRLTMEPRP